MNQLGGVIAALLVAGCAPADRSPKFRTTGATTPRDGGTLRFAVKDQVPTLDPTIANDENALYVLHPLFDTLIDFAPNDLEIVPRLAERWSVSPDGLLYTFELRPGITFSDGVPITAAHFKYSLERALRTADSPFNEYLRDIEGAHDVMAGSAATCLGITTPRERELKVKLAQVNPALLGILTMSFATPQRAEYVRAAGDQLRRQPDATGPFMLERWDEGERVVLKRNPHYFDPSRAHLDKIEMLENVASDAQFQMFERAELDAAEKLAVPDYLFVMTEPAWQPYVHRSTVMNSVGSRMNVRVKPFDDRRVRQALNYALDKRHTQRLLNGTTVPAHGILPPGMFGRDPDLEPYPHDVVKARALLAEAGYPGGVDVDYVTTNDDETQKVAESLQSDLAEVGVRIHLTVMSYATWITAIGKPSGPPFSFMTWAADFPDPSAFLDPLFHSQRDRDGSSNNSFYANPALDALLDAARQEPDRGRREALYRRAEQILHDDAPWIWDYHRETTEVIQPYVGGYKPHPIWERDYTSAWLDVGADGAPVAR